MTEYCMRCMLPTGGAGACPHCGYGGGEPELPHRLRPGTVLSGRYLVGNVLGQGGFGITYIGRDLTLDKRVAIKEYYPNGSANRNVEHSPEITITDRKQADFIEAGKKKFLAEARALAQFEDDPGVVTVRDYFEANRTAYIVMEYLDGQDLRTYLKGARFTADRIFALMAPVMDALEKIHGVGIIHRDISPENIMLLKNGTVKLMDFGAARQLDLSGDKSVSVVLKAGYAPEEQYRTRGKQGPWTDIYALCATIYRCITGLKPDDALERVCLDEMKWPSQLGVEITALQEEVLKKGMAVRAEDRFQSIREMKEMLWPQGSPSHGLELDDDGDVTRRVPRERKDTETECQKEEPPASGRRKRLWLPVVLVLAAVLAGVGIFWGVSRLTDPGTGRNGGVSQADIDGGGYMRVILTAHEDLSVRDFAQAAETIEGRVDLLCDGQPYDIAVEEDQIKLFLPRSVIQPLGLEKTMQCYVSRPMAFSLINYQEYQTDRTDVIPVTPSDVASIAIETQAPEGLAAPDLEEALEKGGLEKLVFTEEFVQAHGAEMAQWGENLALAQDIDSSGNMWYCMLFSAGDGRTFYITNIDGGVFARLHQYNLTRDPLPKPFYFYADMNYEADWETPETAEQAGEFQRAFDQVAGETVTLVFPWVDGDEPPEEGRWADACAAVKRRLDLVGEPYAFGTIESEEDHQMVVKTGGSYMSVPLLQLLEYRQTAFSISAGLNQLYVSQLEWTLRPDGTYALEATVSSSSQEELAEILDLARQQGCGKAYLRADGIPLLACRIEDGADGPTLTFDQGCFWDDGPIGEAESWVVKLPAAISQDANLPSGPSAAQYQCNEDADGIPFDDAGFAVAYSDLTRQVEENIRSAPAAEPYDKLEISSSGTEVRVYLHIDTGKNFAAQVVALAKDLYQQSGFEQSSVTSLYLYFIDEDESEKERARIWFSKTYGSGSSLPGYVWGGGIFTGGRMEEYVEELQTLIEEDPFFLEKKTVEDSTFCDYEAWW